MTAASPIRIWDIPGGIHPEENKLQSLSHGIETLPLPKQLIVPLQQHLLHHENGRQHIAGNIAVETINQHQFTPARRERRSNHKPRTRNVR